MKKIILYIASVVLLTSCDSEFLESDLQGTIDDDKISKLAEESPEALLIVAESFDTGAINGLRTSGISGEDGHNDFGQKSVDIMMDLMGQDMIDANNGWWYDDVYKFMARTQDAPETAVIWGYYYAIIKGTNQTIGLIGNLPESSLTKDLKYVLARSKALRGFCYLQLIQIYQKGNPSLTDLGVPIINPGADVVSGPGFGRMTVKDVYGQIESDLNYGYEKLSGFSRTHKSQLNEMVVSGFLARYHLLRKNYQDAIKYAKIAKSGGALAASELTDGFQFIANPGVIWGSEITDKTTSLYASFFAQIQSFSPNYFEANDVTPGYPGQVGHHRTVDKKLYEAVSDTDIRKSWFGKDNGNIKSGSSTQIYNYKFYDDTFFEGDYIYMRVAEMYLIVAEAEAELGNYDGASSELFNLISTRDSGYTKSVKSGKGLIDEIRTQRRIELWGEGFGLLDVKRWGGDLVRDYSGSNHVKLLNISSGDSRFTWQIPESEINTNDAIGSEDQNPI